MFLCVQSERISHASKLESELYARDPRRAPYHIAQPGISSQPWFEWKQQSSCSLARYLLMMLSYIHIQYSYVYFIEEIETVGNAKPSGKTHKTI